MATLYLEAENKISPELRKIKRQINDMDGSANRLGKSLGKIGKTNLLAGLGASALALTGLIAGFAKGFSLLSTNFADINLELENLEILLETATGSAQAADKAMDDMFEFAETAPFSIDSLTDSFVKLKVSGLDPMDGTLRTLTDSVAAFGGGSDQLKLVTVAIQQMVGKGVISMEELRRQFGEQVPTAMRSMAEGLGLTMREMIYQIENGALEANRGINAMLGVLAEKHGGAAEARMSKMQGAIITLENAWKKLMRAIGKSEAWDAVTGFLKHVGSELNRFVESAAGMAVIDSIGEDIATFFNELQGELDIGHIIETIADFTKETFNLLKNLKDIAVPVIETIENVVSAVAKGMGPFGTYVKLVSKFYETVQKFNPARIAKNLFFSEEDLKGLGTSFDDFITKVTQGMSGMGAYLDDALDLSGTDTELKERLEAQLQYMRNFEEQLTQLAGIGVITMDSAPYKLVRSEIESIIDQLFALEGRTVHTTLEIETKTTGDDKPDILTSGHIAAIEAMEERINKAIEDAQAIETTYTSMIADVDKAIETSTQNIAKYQEDLLNTQASFSKNLRDLMYQGVDPKEVFEAQTAAIQHLLSEADFAQMAEDTEAYTRYLNQALEIANSLSTQDLDPIDQETVGQARTLASVEAEMARGVTYRAQQYNLVKSIQDKILKSKEDLVTKTEEEKTAQEELKAEYESQLAVVQEQITALQHAATDVTAVLGETGSSFQTVFNQVESGVNGLINGLGDSQDMLRQLIAEASKLSDAVITVTYVEDDIGRQVGNTGYVEPVKTPTTETDNKPSEDDKPSDTKGDSTSRSASIVNNFNTSLSKNDIEDISTRQHLNLARA